MVQNRTVFLNSSNAWEPISGVSGYKIRATLQNFSWDGVCGYSLSPLGGGNINSVVLGCSKEKFLPYFLLCSNSAVRECEDNNSGSVSLYKSVKDISAIVDIDFIQDTQPLFDSSSADSYGASIVVAGAVLLSVLT